RHIEEQADCHDTYACGIPVHRAEEFPECDLHIQDDGKRHYAHDVELQLLGCDHGPDLFFRIDPVADQLNGIPYDGDAVPAAFLRRREYIDEILHILLPRAAGEFIQDCTC